MKKRIAVLPTFLIALGTLLASCGGGGGTTTLPTSNPATTPTGSSGSYSQLAELGSHIYVNNCARCHGANGQGGVGPALVGNANTHLAYLTAASLLSKISTTMPQDKPGTLSQTEYYQVLCFLLVQNNWVNAIDIFNPSNLSQINLKYLNCLFDLSSSRDDDRRLCVDLS